MRSKKALINTISGLCATLITIICTFILQRLILTAFGSEYNGLTSSINQFLTVTVLFQAGLSDVAKFTFYKPLAEKNREEISCVMSSVKSVLKKITMALIVYVTLLAVFYPFLVSEEFGWLFTFSLIMIMSVSTIMQTILGLAPKTLLGADQRQVFTYAVSMFTMVLNTVTAVILIQLGFGIQGVQLGSMFVFILQPVAYNYYVNKKYQLDKNAKSNTDVLKQRWDNFAIQVAKYVHDNTDVIIVTIFLDLKEVSVYVVYNLVRLGVLKLFNPLTDGLGAAFGNMLANGEYETAKKNLWLFEELIFAVTTFLTGVSMTMVISFVILYTNSVTDVNYSRTLFAYLMMSAVFFECVRVPYQKITISAGHFKQVRNGAFIEAFLNIAISLILVFKLGIVGVMVGTLISMIFRTFQYAMYLSKNIIKRSLFIFIKRLVLSIIGILLIVLIARYLPLCESGSFVEWIMKAVVVSAIAAAIVLLTEIIFYKNDLKGFIKTVKSALRGKGKH